MATNSFLKVAKKWFLLRPFCSGPNPSEFRPRKALILTKVSRYEFERRRLSQREPFHGVDSTSEVFTESEFRDVLTKRGSDYDSMRRHHDIHKDTESQMIEALKSRGVQVRCLQRHAYDQNHIDWADVIFTAGGDGTFLLGASKITSYVKPVIGINTDSTRSEGHLCIPKRYSACIERAVDCILNGKFRWMFRRRLRITVNGDQRSVYAPAVEIYNQQLKYPEYRYIDLLSEQSVSAQDHPLTDPTNDKLRPSTRVLPVLALNEVFFGESLSSRVSHLEVKFDDDREFIKSRNSGLCISTGTGSTSWTYNINKLTKQSVEALMRIIHETGHPVDFTNDNLIEAVTSKFNNQLLFDSEANIMSYTVRDPISMSKTDFVGGVGEHLLRKPRGKAKRIEVKSKCFDACLVIDGSLSYKFNDGTHAVVEIKDDDALRTIELDLTC